MQLRDGPLEILIRGGGGWWDFGAAGIFFGYQIPYMIFFFLGHSMNIFFGLIGVHEFFSFYFPLCEYLCCTSPVPHPLPPL